MARKKTKEEKIKTAQQKRQELAVYSLSSSVSTTSLRKDKGIRTTDSPLAFGFDQKMVLKDLAKTVIISSIVVSILVGLTLYNPW